MIEIPRTEEAFNLQYPGKQQIDVFFFIQAAQASTTLPARYQRLGFEFATVFKKITFANGFCSRFEDLALLWLDRI